MREAYPNELYHHGILGQKWGVRRFQNKDGSLTSAGKKRYETSDGTKKSLEEMSPNERKAKLIAEADTKELKKFAKDLSIDEYRQALERVRLDATLKEFDYQDKHRKLRSFDEWAGRARNITSTVNDVWNMTATVNNLVNPNRPIPTLNGPQIWDPDERRYLSTPEITARKSYVDYKIKQKRLK